jgi:methylglutaconyl-CoA hydratase
VNSSATCIDFEVSDSDVGTLQLSRPLRRNAFDADMIAQISGVLQHCHGLEKLRVLKILAQGPVFCAGADLNYMQSQALFSAAENERDAKRLAEMFYLLVSLPMPTVAYVQGAAIGGGLGILACVDYVSAERSCVFATSEVKLGLVPGVISPYVVRKLGSTHAFQIMLSGARFGAVDALRFGLIQHISESGTAKRDATLDDYVGELMSASSEATRVTKKLVQQMNPLPTQAQIDFSILAIAQARSSSQGREGVAAFFEKRKPNWCTL